MICDTRQVTPFRPAAGRRTVTVGGLAILLRPLREDDDRLFHAYDLRVTDDDRRLRFFASLEELSDGMIETLTHFDRGSALAVIALDPGGREMLGVARAHRTEGREGEFALAVRSDLKGKGLGHALMGELVRQAAGAGLTSIHGLVLRENRRMLDFVRQEGFAVTPVPDEPGLLRASRSLAGPASAGPPPARLLAAG